MLPSSRNVGQKPYNNVTSNIANVWIVSLPWGVSSGVKLTSLGPKTGELGHHQPTAKKPSCFPHVSLPLPQTDSGHIGQETHALGEAGGAWEGGSEPSKPWGSPFHLCGPDSHRLTHAVLHHHESAFVAFVTLALEVPWGVHTLATAAEVRRDPAFVDIWMQAAVRQDSVSGQLSFLGQCGKGEELYRVTDLCSSFLQSQEQSHCHTCT